MRKMKKILLAATCMTVTGVALCGCNNSENEETKSTIQTTNQEAEAELTTEEKYAVILLQYIQDSLKNPHSLKVYTIKCNKADEYGCDIYVEYSGTNDYGADVESGAGYNVGTVYFTGTSEEVENAVLWDTGITESVFISKDDCEITLDVDKVMKHIDDKVY